MVLKEKTVYDYQEKATFAFDSYYVGSLRSIPDPADHNHIINIARSVMMTRDKIMMGGSFVTAVVENNLDSAVERADSVCAQHLAFFVYCKKFVHIS